jgi:uncharacterized protein (DUF983 family)
MILINKIKAWWRGETCPTCNSWKIKRGPGFTLMTCVSCNKQYALVDVFDNPCTPQMEGKLTLYEEWVIENE